MNAVPCIHFQLYEPKTRTTYILTMVAELA